MSGYTTGPGSSFLGGPNFDKPLTEGQAEAETARYQMLARQEADAARISAEIKEHRESSIAGFIARATEGDLYAKDALYWAAMNGDIPQETFESIAGISMANYDPEKAREEARRANASGTDQGEPGITGIGDIDHSTSDIIQ